MQIHHYEKPPSSSDLLKRLKSHKGKKISIGEIVESFREGGFSLLLIIFAAPLAVPLPALGIAQVMAIPIMLLSLQLALGHAAPWLPKKISKKKVELAKLRAVVDKALPAFYKMEKLVKPRLGLFATRIGHSITGMFCVLCSISIATPVPFSNTIPSMGVVLMSIGLLERDGLFIVLGMLVGFAGISFAISVYYFGIEAIMALFS